MLRAGYASADITPGTDCRLLGYPFPARHMPTPNAGVHDPLAARVLVLDDGQSRGRAVLVSLELAIVSTAAARHLRAAVAAAVGTTADRVLLACTHTHSGPDLEEPDEAYRRGAVLPGSGAWNQDSPGQRYMAGLAARVTAAAQQAAGLLVPVRLDVNEAPLGLGYTRRVATPAGIRHCWNPEEYPHLSPGGAADPTCTALVFTQENGPRRWVLWSAGVHPVTLGKTSRVVSADWPGAACRLICAYAPASGAVFLAGACGDVHPWVATQEDPAGLEPVSRAAAAFVALQCRGLRPADCGEVRTAASTLTIGNSEQDIMVWRMGRAWIAAAPVEIFSAFAASLRARIGGPGIFATNANGWTGYWPTAQAFSEGGYEIDSAKGFGRGPGDGEALVEALAGMARET